MRYYAQALMVVLVTTSVPVMGQCPPTAVSVWRLDEAVSGTYSDSLGVSAGTCDGLCPTPVSGQVAGAQSFDGVGAIVVPANRAYDFAVGSSFTIEAWARTTATGAAATLVGRVDPDGSSLGIFLGLFGDGNIGFSLVSTAGEGISGFISSPATMADGEWHHFVAVRDDAESLNLLYVDGLLVDSAVVTYTTGFDSATASVGLGFTPGASDESRFVGDLDEVAIYSSALTPEDISEHYQLGLLGLGVCDVFPPAVTSIPPLTTAVGSAYPYQVAASGNPAPTYSLLDAPSTMGIDATTGMISWVPTLLDTGPREVTVAATNSEGAGTQSFVLTVEQDVFVCPPGMVMYLPLDETQGGFFRDRVGDVDVSSVGTHPLPTTGVVSGAQSFAGVEVGLSGDPDDTLDFGAGQSFSLECWFRMNDPGTEIMFGRIDLDNGLELWIGQFQGKVAFLAKDTSGSPGVFATSANTYNDGNWHHAVGVQDAATNSLRVYVDGGLETDLPSSFSADFVSTEAPLTVGWLASGSGFSYRGDADELAAYDRALTPEEIEEHFVRGLDGQRLCDPVCPLVAIVSPPVVACEGDTVTLLVEALGTTPLAFEWSRNGVPIPEASGPVLTIDTRDDDAGSYSVLVTNDCGSATDDLSVSVIATPMILVAPESVMVCEGDSVELVVDASGDDLQYQWFHEGALIAGETLSALGIVIGGPEDLGAYSVQISNGCSVVETLPANVELSAACGGNFRRGDLNGDGRQDIADVVVAYTYVAARGLPMLCADAFDFDDDGDFDDVDAFGMAMHYFLGGPFPAAPYPGCGADTTGDVLDCRVSPCP